jgi:hypothetical protein
MKGTSLYSPKQISNFAFQFFMYNVSSFCGVHGDVIHGGPRRFPFVKLGIKIQKVKLVFQITWVFQHHTMGFLRGVEEGSWD